MNGLIWGVIIIGSFVFTVGGTTLAVLMYRAGFKNRAIIFRRTGKSIDDFIIFQDRFQVYFKEGKWMIKFLRQNEKTKSVEGKYWKRFLAPKYEKKVLSYSTDEWDTLDFRDKIQRGLILYETREGHYYPMNIVEGERGANFAPDFDQDTRAFLAQETIEAANLTRNKRTEKLILIGIIIGMCVLGLTGMVIFYFMQKNGQANVAESARVCAEYAKTVINVSTGGNPNFLSSIVAPTVGG